MSGPELAGRLGLEGTWAYFSVERGKSITPEPDVSGQPPALTPSPSSSTSTGPQGGAQASGRSNATAAGPQGGAQAPAGPDLSLTGGVAAR